MFIHSHYLVYPNGDSQEIAGPVPFNALVGMNGEPLDPPVRRGSIIYRVFRIQREENRGESTHMYFLELVEGAELFSLYR